jgi:hypothetical protein
MKMNWAAFYTSPGNTQPNCIYAGLLWEYLLGAVESIEHDPIDLV